MSPTAQPASEMTLSLALIPILFLVGLLACSVYLFGADSSYGANQVALVLTACVAALVGRRVGISWSEAQNGIIDGIAVGLAPILILLAVGMLIGSWILSGTVPAMIYYGVQVLNPTIFYAASAAICAIVALSIGSSWTVAGTLGIGLMGIAASFELSGDIGAVEMIVASALCGVVFALLFQPRAVIGLAGGDAGTGAGFALLKGVWISLFDGYSSNSDNAFLNELLSKGGMSSMLNTVWLIICALGLGGVLERTGILGYLLRLALRGVRSAGSLITVTVMTCLGTNILAADQFISVALPGRMYIDQYRRFGLSRLNLSRTLEDSGTLTSALIPWNTCGAYMSATLGVATFSYAPFAFFNLLCPLLAILYGYIHFALKPLESQSDATLADAS